MHLLMHITCCGREIQMLCGHQIWRGKESQKTFSCGEESTYGAMFPSHRQGSFSLCFKHSLNFSVIKSSFSSRVKCIFCGRQSLQDPTVLLPSLMWKLAGESYFCESEITATSFSIHVYFLLSTAYVPLIQKWIISSKDEQ